jgi:signal transduction histidine kinase
MLRLQHEGTDTERLRWSEPIWEQFRAESAERSAYATVVLTILCTVLLLAWSVGDYAYFPEHATRFTYYRVAAVSWCVALAILAAKLQRPRAKLLAMWLWFLAWGAESAAMIPYTPEHLLSHVFVMVIAQLGSPSFMVWSWRWSLTMSLAQLGMGEIALWRVGFHRYDIFAAHAYLATGMALCVLFTVVKYRGAREQFDQRLRLQEEKQRTESLLQQVTSMREERVLWLENLARFLRHELKNQVVAIGTSLDLVERRELDAPVERYVGRARQSLGRMKRLVETATEATSLEATLDVEAKAPLDLGAIVGERVLVFRRAHPDRTFYADIESGLLVDGNEDRLAQLLDKLLDNAVEHSPLGGKVWVSSKREDREVVVMVQNDGDALPLDKEALFDPFVTFGKANSESHNLGLGLFVAGVITESHGGSIIACDLPNTAGARFVVRLPVLRDVSARDRN